jgi:hypothetical protein
MLEYVALQAENLALSDEYRPMLLPSCPDIAFESCLVNSSCKILDVQGLRSMVFSTLDFLGHETQE